MEKIISIIVPTYNMEKYLSRCLSSVLDHKWDEDVEVIVVNDGSTDSSLQIAMEYQEQYPSIVTIINKENGNYGSTINAALPVVKGKYVRILDADDWYDKKEFELFLDGLKNIDCDLVLTHYTRNHISGEKKTIFFPVKEYNKNYDFSIITSEIIMMKLRMHTMTYKTEILRKADYKQTEGIFYTDTEWMFYPLFFVSTIRFVNANIYQYFLGREGQSVSKTVVDKNVDHLLQIAEKKLLYYYSLDKDKLSVDRKTYFFKSFTFELSNIYVQCLFFLSDSEFDPHALKKLEQIIIEKDETLYHSLLKFKLHRFPIIYLWRRYYKRLPDCIVKAMLIIWHMVKRLGIVNN